MNLKNIQTMEDIYEVFKVLEGKDFKSAIGILGPAYAMCIMEGVPKDKWIRSCKEFSKILENHLKEILESDNFKAKETIH
jgi:hypothetical protein